MSSSVKGTRTRAGAGTLITLDHHITLVDVGKRSVPDVPDEVTAPATRSVLGSTQSVDAAVNGQRLLAARGQILMTPTDLCSPAGVARLRRLRHRRMLVVLSARLEGGGRWGSTSRSSGVCAPLSHQ
jgi:hypothetical protein